MLYMVPFCPHLRRTCNPIKGSITASGSFQHEGGPANLDGRSVSKTFDQVASVSRDTTKPFVLVDAMSDVTTKTLRESDGEITIRAGEREVYRSTSSLLRSQESRVHSFAIVDLPPTYSVNIKVSRASHPYNAHLSNVQRGPTISRWFRGAIITQHRGARHSVMRGKHSLNSDTVWVLEDVSSSMFTNYALSARYTTTTSFPMRPWTLVLSHSFGLV